MTSHRAVLTLDAPEPMAFVHVTPQAEEAPAPSSIRGGFRLANPLHGTSSVFIDDTESGLHSS